MSIGIITYHRAINYGAILQTYALQNYLTNHFDRETYVIDYLSKKIDSDYSTKYTMKSIVKKFLVGRYEDITKKKFESFMMNNLVLSKSFDADTISNVSNLYDVYFTGSDQVWNYKGNNFDSNYFLNFVSDINKRNSYAASIGMSSIPQEYNSFYYENLKKMNMISVREKSAKRIIDEFNLNKTVQVVVDPTLLLNKNDWFKLIKDKIEKQTKQEYILIYSFSLSDSLYKLAIDLSKKTGLPIYSITNSPKNWRGIKKITGVGPLDFLSLFFNAKYILTNSFHGTAFAINFNKVFWVDLSTSVNKAVTSRITDLLEELNIKERSNLVPDNLIIDYNLVNSKLELMREKSNHFLSMVCSNE